MQGKVRRVKELEISSKKIHLSRGLNETQEDEITQKELMWEETEQSNSCSSFFHHLWPEFGTIASYLFSILSLSPLQTIPQPP